MGTRRLVLWTVVAERAGEATVLFEVKGKQEKFYKKERS